MSKNKKRKGYYIFRASMKTKSGEIIYARDYGLRAFKIWIET